MIKTLIKRSAMMIALCISTAVMADYPIGQQDRYTIPAGTDIYIEVLKNDSGENLRVVESNNWTVKGGRTYVGAPAPHGRERMIRYIPKTGFVGEDEFWYVLADEDGRTNAAKVTINVVNAAESRWPDPQEDVVSVKKDTRIRIDVLANDGATQTSPTITSYPDIVEFNEWSKNGGRISLDNTIPAEQQLIYTPPSGFVGTDEFWYVMQAPGSVKHAAKVTVNVTEFYASGPYPRGIADNLFVSGTSRGSQRIAYYPLDNDKGENLRIVDKSGYSQNGGTFAVQNGRRMTYTPPRSLENASEAKQDKVWYVIEDELGRKNWSVITFTIPAGYQG